MKLIDYIITVFVMADDFCKIYFPERKIRARGPLPKLADSEVITMELVGEYLGLKTDESIYNYFSRHCNDLFANLPDRSNFVRQCANLWGVKQRFFEYLSHSEDKYLQIIDSVPIEVCKFVRAKSSRQFKDTAAYGKWLGQTFFGYRLHLKITDYGMIRNFAVAPANEHDIGYVETLLADDSGGWVLGDKGYRSKDLHNKLWQQRRTYFHTSLRRIDKKVSPLPRETIRTLTGKRRLIETVAGQLEQRFGIKTTVARDLWHLLSRIIRKILSHTVCVFLNLKLNIDPLKLRLLVN
jgi:IS5 family transposase